MKANFHLYLQLLLFFNSVNSRSTLPYRELLSLKTQHKEKTSSALKKSYIVQRIIWLFCEYRSDNSGQTLLRDVIMDSVEEEGDVVRQGTWYSQVITIKSEGMINGLYKKENDDLELSKELEVLFLGTGVALIK